MTDCIDVTIKLSKRSGVIKYWYAAARIVHYRYWEFLLSNYHCYIIDKWLLIPQSWSCAMQMQIFPRILNANEHRFYEWSLSQNGFLQSSVFDKIDYYIVFFQSKTTTTLTIEIECPVISFSSFSLSISLSLSFYLTLSISVSLSLSLYACPNVGRNIVWLMK